MKVVLVTGAGRSGTSTVAGALAKLGLHLPGPEVPADETNPRGFFESQWVVDLHKEMLDLSPIVRTVDARPGVAALLDERSADPVLHERLVAWLREQSDHPQVLVKDPRAFWFHTLWRRACAEVGAELVFLTMLRHPAEVARSRDAAYLADQQAGFRRRRVVGNVAAWTNVAVITEEVTRTEPRAFVRYADLLTDWRGALAPAVAALGLDVDLGDGPGPQAVDDFVDAGLVRAGVAWSDLDVPTELRGLAEEVWGQMERLVADPDATGATGVPGVADVLASAGQRYARLHDDAVGIALDHTNSREVHVRRNAKRNTARDYQERIDELEAQLTEVTEGEVEDAERSGDAPGLDLARRVARRVRRG